MDSGGKQRVIGACVLVAIGVLFLPVLLDRSEEQVIDTTSQIPPKPNFTLYQHQQPSRPEQSAPAPSEEVLFLPEQDKAVVNEPIEPATVDQPSSEAVASPSPAPEPDVQPSEDHNRDGLDAQGLPKSWVVQVASFTDEARATKLVQTLLEDDYRAYFRRVVRGEKSLYRVYVGPNINRDAALRLKSKLDTKLNADTLVLRLAP